MIPEPGDSDRTVVIYEEGASLDRELSSVIEGTLRRASQAYRVLVAPNEPTLQEYLATTTPLLLIVDIARTSPLDFERLVSSLRSGSATRCLPVLVTVEKEALAGFQEVLGLPLVDFITRPFEAGELWSRIRVCQRQAAAYAELVRENERLSRQSVTDGLTGLYNTTYLVAQCNQEIARAKRYDLPVSCLLVDIDGFKSVNDTYGHPVGNEVLRGLARLIAREVRGSDTVGRYGGEEFLLLLPQTDGRGAAILAERLRRVVEEAVFAVGPNRVKITVSIGVATFPGPGIMGQETLFLAVDRAVYAAKKEGRNRVAYSDSALSEVPG